MNSLTASEARALAIEAQGLGRPRPKGPATLRHLRGAIDAVGTVQLDAINVVDRTQYLVLFGRIGAYPKQKLHDLCGPGGELFEYWGHAASLLPVNSQPLFRWLMAQSGPYGHRPAAAAWRSAYGKDNKKYLAAVLAEVRDRGPLPASQLSDPRRRDGEWWDRRSEGRVALEWLFARGDVAAWRAPNFERIYDIPERVIPPEVLASPTPSKQEAQRALVLWAARSVGVGTVADLANYFHVRPQQDAKRSVAELVAAGELVEVTVEGWRERGYMLPATAMARLRRDHATLLSPFDSLIWDRARIARLWNFDYTIEVYTPEPKRTYGYYVLPMLLGDELVGRFDLKSDRAASALRVRGAFAEPGVDRAAVAEAAATELRALSAWLGLDDLAVERRGNLAADLRRAQSRR